VLINWFGSQNVPIIVIVPLKSRVHANAPH
jgi:hypothetical protein